MSDVLSNAYSAAAQGASRVALLQSDASDIYSAVLGQSGLDSDILSAVRAIQPVTDQLRQSVKTIVEGTCDAGGTTTAIIAATLTPASGVNDQFNGRIIIFTEDTTTVALRGQATAITDYVHATLTFTVTALTTAPAAGDTFCIL